jgi:hypothetical protein
MRTLTCFSLLLLAGCSSLQTAQTRSGSISGKIAYPSETTPDMRICAVQQSGSLRTCMQVKAGDTDYRIEHLAPADYLVVAQLHEGDMRVGGHMYQVQCIRAPCPAHLQAVTVAAGAAVTGVDINDFYAAMDDFPDVPADGK